MSKDKIFKNLIIVLMVVYLGLYFAASVGYYDYKSYNKVALTEEQIIKFEEDVKNGKEVNVDDYIVKEKKIHNNKIGKLGKRMSFTISGAVSKVLSESFRTISKFVIE